MSVLLSSFGAGIAFAIGAVVGVWICSLSISRERKAAVDEARRHYAAVEDRLTKQAMAVVEIAAMMKKKP